MNNLEKLKDKFSPLDIEWRVQSCGETNGKIWARVLAYVDARAVQDRLDEVVGMDHWQTDFSPVQGGTLCRLSIKINDEWVVKTDGSQETDVEPFKGGISKSFVRAASQWGVGRYLYNLDSTWATIVERGTPNAKGGQTKDRKTFYWTPPDLPKWALPGPTMISRDSGISIDDVNPSIAQQIKQTAQELFKQKGKDLNHAMARDKQSQTPPQKQKPCECGLVMKINKAQTWISCPKWNDGKKHSSAIAVK